MTKCKIIQLLRNRGLISELVNPGGRELRFSDGTTLQLADQDEEEDHRSIIEFCRQSKTP